MNDVQIAATILVVIAAIVGLFQIALASGAPWGEWAFGGQHKGRLPRSLRISSGVSLLVYAVQVLHFGSRAGFWTTPLGDGTAAVLDWVFVAFFVLGTIMNGISRSPRERYLWTPVVMISLACALWVTL